MKSISRVTRVVGGLALLVAAASSSQAAPGQAWEANAPIAFTNGSFSFSDVFTVGATSLILTSLGAIDLGSSGFVSAGGIPVGLYREADHVLLASTRVTSSDPLIGHYRYSDISDILLSANTQYRVVAVSLNDLYNIASPTPNSVDPRITWNRYGYCSSTVLVSCDNSTGTGFTWMGNMLLDSNTTQVPEPGSLALVGLALLVLSATQRGGHRSC
jgi:hypothetical protein